MPQPIGNPITAHTQSHRDSGISSNRSINSQTRAASHAQTFPSSSANLISPAEKDFFSSVQKFVKLPSAYNQTQIMIYDNLRQDKSHRDELETIAARTIDLKGKTQQQRQKHSYMNWYTQPIQKT